MKLNKSVFQFYDKVAKIVKGADIIFRGAWKKIMSEGILFINNGGFLLFCCTILSLVNVKAYFISYTVS